MPTDLVGDCARCAGLSCVTLPFARSADFPVDKAAGDPCDNLKSDFSCTIHDRLPEAGFRGCTVFDCFGAGQQVTQVTEMLFHLTEALRWPEVSTVHDELATARTEIIGLSDSDVDALRSLDVGALRGESARCSRGPAGSCARPTRQAPGSRAHAVAAECGAWEPPGWRVAAISSVLTCTRGPGPQPVSHPAPNQRGQGGHDHTHTAVVDPPARLVRFSDAVPVTRPLESAG